MKKTGAGTRSIMRAVAEMKSYTDKGWTIDDVVAHFRKHHPERIRTVTKVSVNEPGKHDAASIKKMRLKLGISQAVFAEGLGVSTILVSGWEQGVREPSPLARRLLDVVSRDPAAWLASVTPARKSPRKAG